MPTEINSVLDLKLESLTIDEIDAIEDITGQPIDALKKPGAKRGPMLRAMAFVAMKRKYPDFTVEDAGNLQLRFSKAGPADPTVPSA
ncbi:hypothetical protein [Streptomyces bauhiniae]